MIEKLQKPELSLSLKGKEQTMVPSAVPVSKIEGEEEKERPIVLSGQSFERMEKNRCGMQILEETQRVMQEEKKDTDSSVEKKENSARDTSYISKTRKSESERSTNRAISIKLWTQALELKAWEEILNWNPSHKNLSSDLEELKKLYTKLMADILENTIEPQQSVQLLRLEEVLFSALNQILEGKVNHLFSFFNQYGQKETVDSLQSSLYFMATGREMKAKEGVRFREGRFHVDTAILKSSVQTEKNFNTERIETERIEQAKKVFLHQKEIESGSFRYSSKGVIEKEPVFLEEANGEEQAFQKQAVKIDPASYIAEKKYSFTVHDLQETSIFVQTIQKQAMAFSMSGSLCQREELIGVLTGILALKGIVFCSLSGISSDMAKVLSTSIDKFIFYYIQNADIALRTNMERTLAGKQNQLEQKQIFEIYELILKIYWQTKDPVKAIIKGLEQAIKAFQWKEQKEAGALETSEKRNHFFPSFHRGKYETGEKEGFFVLRNNWNEFLDSLPYPGKKDYYINSKFNLESIWGAMMKGEQTKNSELKKDSFSKFAVFTFVAIFLVIGSVFSIVDGVGGSVYFFVGGVLFLGISFVLRR